MVLSVMVLLAAPVGLLADVRPASTGPSDSVAIHAFWSALDSIWSTRDADAFAQLFTEDASFDFIGRPTSLATRDSIRAYFVSQFSRQRPELRHRTTLRRVFPLAADMAAIDGEVAIVDGAGAGPIIARLPITGVMARTSAGWRIRLLRAYAAASDGP
jgi:uncharacterized protein (TIGR02246 family)